MGKLSIVSVDIDDTILIPIRPAGNPFLIESTTSTTSLIRNIDEATAKSLSPQPGQYAVKVMTASSNACKSLLLQGVTPSYPSYIVYFSDTGKAGIPVSLSDTNLGFPLSRYTLSISDATADGRDDIVVKENGATRGVIVTGSSGSFFLDPKTSASAVWQSFKAAVSAKDANAAIAHLSEGGKQLLSAQLTALGENLPKIVENVVGQHINVVSDKLVIITIVIKTSATTHRAHDAFLTRHDGVWYIDAL